MSSELEYKDKMFVLPLRDVVVLPRMVITLYVGRKLSLNALELAMKEGGQIFLVSQRSAEVENPDIKDLYEVGCAANILQMMRLQDDSIKILVEGLSRARGKFHFAEKELIAAELSPLPMNALPPKEEAKAMAMALKTMTSNYAKVNRRAGGELQAKIEDVDDLQRLTDCLIGAAPMSMEKRQRLFEEVDYTARVKQLLELIGKETKTQKIDQKIRGEVRRQVEKNHREYYLQEQARAIQKELGDDHGKELEEMKERIEKAGMSAVAKKKAEQELKKLRMMPPMSSEATVTRSYLDTLLSLPWKKRGDLNDSLGEARKTLDADHHGLEKVKERILEYLAVQKRVAKGKAPILCFVGAPGVGKTSLGKSIAAATGRVYGRIALGGVRDEAEIRGHRRTYIGAMPGKIANAMIRAETKNPLILLDEIDKMGFDFRGDPSAALLEVLDPEQNSAFSDHYVEVDYDLSEVMFITTANTMNIPPALQDRLEIIRLSGYTEDEKVSIAEQHLIPRQMRETGLEKKEAAIGGAAIRDIVRYYTREAGVRSLERHIGRICRKVVLESEMRDGDSAAAAAAGKARKAAKVVTATTAATATASEVKESAAEATATKTTPAASKKAVKTTTITPASLKKYLGVRRFHHGIGGEENKVGQVNGLAWTEAGGDLLHVEACLFPGKGKIIRTGKLGEVIKESVETAFSVVRARSGELKLPVDFTKDNDFHIHFPEGAIPKDGPSAGIAICTAVLSVASGAPVRADVAMTGEITLRGEVLQIGGVKEKLLAAARANIRHVILPKENEKDMADIPASVTKSLNISFVKWIDEVFALAMAEAPAKKAAPAPAKKKASLQKGAARRKPETPPLPH